jgi:hypothetical protein
MGAYCSRYLKTGQKFTLAARSSRVNERVCDRVGSQPPGSGQYFVLPGAKQGTVMRIPGILALLLICSPATADNSTTRDGRLLKTYTGFVHAENYPGQACKVLRANDGRRYAIFGLPDAVAVRITRVQGQLVRLAKPQCGTFLGIIMPAASNQVAADKTQAVRGLVRRHNMEGTCWGLQGDDGNQYQLTGGDANMYRDGQYVMIPAKINANLSRGECGIGPVLEVTDYFVMEPGLQKSLYVMNRRELVSTIKD